EPREYRGVKVFAGSYDYRGARIVPSWGGSIFEALMVTLFVPEDVWAPRSWGINHPLYVRAQIAHGLEAAGYRYWGFSPAASPRGGYEVYGVKALGTYSLGYFSHEIVPPVPPPLMPHSTRSTHGVVTPIASFLALRYAPHEAVANLRALSGGLPIYGPLGFQDSVDVSEGVTSGRILALGQGMIMAAIANELAWFKNARFRVTLGLSARTLIGPALERVYASPWLPCWGFSSARTACTPEVPASERAAHPSATPQDSCRLDWALHCAGTGGDSGRTEATSSSPSPTAAAGRSSFAAGC